MENSSQRHLLNGDHESIELNPPTKIQSIPQVTCGDIIVNIDTPRPVRRKPQHKDRNLRHRDGLGRVTTPFVKLSLTWNGRDGVYLRPDDGKLTALDVQDSKRLKSQTPAIIRLIYWLYCDVISPDGEDDTVRNDGVNWIGVWFAWLPACLVLLVLLCFPADLGGKIRNNGRYDPVRYREWLYAKVARNRYENEEAITPSRGEPKLIKSSSSLRDETGVSTAISFNSHQHPSAERDISMLKRELGPKFLCFPTGGDGSEYEVMHVQEYMRRTKSANAPTYVFVSYTRKQFCVATAEELQEWDITPEDRIEKLVMSKRDRVKLAQLGIAAARRAGVSAFWLDFECLIPDVASGETSKDMLDVYRICDIVRSAHSMIIVRGPPIEDNAQPATSENKVKWLQQWGTRLWTVPEALLCPSKIIDLYTIGSEAGPEPMLKWRLAAAAWEDASEMRQLIDHYESSIHLTPLELVSIAFGALQQRKTEFSTKGDASYALMGLLRRRPIVDKNDSDFEAFARLSLANDSDMLLERLLCMQPLEHRSPWSEIRDGWEAHLWDIEPHCQIAGIVDNRTVTLDGAYGATIQWHELEDVAFIRRSSVWRIFAIVALRTIPLTLICGISLAASGTVVKAKIDKPVSQGDASSADQTKASVMDGPLQGQEAAGYVIIALAVVLLLIAPKILLNSYRGKFWSTQACFFGMRGIPDLGRVEKCIFGINCGRLKWSASGSLLSRHHLKNGECVALPPDEKTLDKKGLELYTIVDTFAMTATPFLAEKPPSVVMICGREGGMQRAVLCSYDWQTQTFCREAVVRMKTLVLERMSRVDRFRFCLSRYGWEPSI